MKCRGTKDGTDDFESYADTAELSAAWELPAGTASLNSNMGNRKLRVTVWLGDDVVREFVNPESVTIDGDDLVATIRVHMPAARRPRKAKGR